MAGQVRIVNTSVACSSLVLGWFQFYGAEITPKSFSQFVFRACLEAEHDTYMDEDGDERAYLDGYGVKDFAFICASTDEEQGDVEKMLRHFGFMETPRTSKNKNPEHHCIFWMAQAVPVFDKMREYDPAGWEKLGINVAKNDW